MEETEPTSVKLYNFVFGKGNRNINDSDGLIVECLRNETNFKVDLTV